MLWSSAASMPSNQIFFSVMFVGKCSCTSHVLQYSLNLSYEHSRSLQSILCPEVVTVLICWASLHVFSPQQSWCKHRFACMACRKRSFFVAALLNLHNFEKRRQNYTLFYNLPNFSAFFCIFTLWGNLFFNVQCVATSVKVLLTSLICEIFA